MYSVEILGSTSFDLASTQEFRETRDLSTATLTDAELLQAGYRYALAFTHCTHDAEDLVHDGWLKLCRRYGSVKSRSALFIAVRNLFIDRYRRRQIVVFQSLEEVDPAFTPLADSDKGCLKGDLDDLLAILRPTEREMLFLHYHQGYTAQEIATSTGRPRASVLSMIHRAIGKLRLASDDSFK